MCTYLTHFLAPLVFYLICEGIMVCLYDEGVIWLRMEDESPWSILKKSGILIEHGS